MKNRIIKIIALLLIILPINTLIVNLFPSIMYKGNIILYDIIVFYLPITIGIIIYKLNMDKNTKNRLFTSTYIITAISFFSLVLYELTTTNSTSFGDGLLLGFIGYGGLYVTKILALVMLIKDNKKYIFSIKVLIIVLIIAILAFVSYKIILNLTTIKVDENIPTLLDFKKELEKRELLVEDAKIYGVKSNEPKITRLSFDKNSNDKYPMYIYAGYESSEIFPWLIYYINGNIYAIPGQYYYFDTISKDEKLIWKTTRRVIISESNEITIYNVKNNYYQTGTIVESEEVYYHTTNKDEIKIYAEIPKIRKSETTKCINCEIYYTLDKVDLINKTYLEKHY